MRVDQLLVQRGLFPSREKARRSIMAGQVLVDGQRVDKPGTAVGEAVAVEVKGNTEPFVSRAGRKLDGALDHFGIAAAGRICLDVGASTGGFTDCLLQRGAEKVYAVDVGYNQLDYRLRTDPRVVVMERVNARYLEPDQLPERASLCVVDVSFISLTKVVPALVPLLDTGADLVPLIKPQFEAGREAVGKGGIVRDEEVRRRVIDERVGDIERLGFTVRDVIDSGVAGVGGNVEALAHFVRDEGVVS
ncbi:MAG: TlyA family RNA methyltransferase [Acidobacteriota bacterium]